MSGLPWFRMYTDFLDDPKMISLAFEDQRHFIAVCALKCTGVLDQDTDSKTLNRIVAQKLWLDYATIDDVKKRLVDSGLIDSTWNPVAWEKRQKRSDRDPTAAERQARRRQKLKKEQEDSDSHALRHATVTPLEEKRVEEKREEQSREEPTSPPSFSFAKHLSEQYGYPPHLYNAKEIEIFKAWEAVEVTQKELKEAHGIACKRKGSSTPSIAYINGIIKNDRADEESKPKKKKRKPRSAGQIKSTDPLGENTAAYEEKAAARLAEMAKAVVTQ